MRFFSPFHEQACWYCLLCLIYAAISKRSSLTQGSLYSDSCALPFLVDVPELEILELFADVSVSAGRPTIHCTLSLYIVSNCGFL